MIVYIFGNVKSLGSVCSLSNDGHCLDDKVIIIIDSCEYYVAVDKPDPFTEPIPQIRKGIRVCQWDSIVCHCSRARG